MTTVETVSLGDFTVALHRERLAPQILAAIEAGRYESRELNLVKHVFRAGERVIELGGGIGLTSMAIARIVGVENVRSYEANPDLIDWARENHALNGLSGIGLENRVLMAPSQLAELSSGTVPFHVMPHFWASSLEPSPGALRTIEVPVGPLTETIREWGATGLMVDIEGAEVALLAEAKVPGIRKIVMEVHYPKMGRKRTDQMIRSLVQRGFAVDLVHSGQGVVYLYR